MDDQNAYFYRYIIVERSLSCMTTLKLVNESLLKLINEQEETYSFRGKKRESFFAAVVGIISKEINQAIIVLQEIFPRLMSIMVSELEPTPIYLWIIPSFQEQDFWFLEVSKCEMAHLILL